MTRMSGPANISTGRTQESGDSPAPDQMTISEKRWLRDSPARTATNNVTASRIGM